MSHVDALALFPLVDHHVDVFSVPSTPLGAPPRPAPGLVVSAETIDAARETARAVLAARGLRVRALSSTPRGLVAYVEEAL